MCELPHTTIHDGPLFVIFPMKQVLEAFDGLEGVKQVLAALSASMLLLKSGSGQELKQEKQVHTFLVPCFSCLGICLLGIGTVRFGVTDNSGLSPGWGGGGKEAHSPA